MATKKCLICGKEFSASVSFLNRYKNWYKFCSKKCSAKFNGNNCKTGIEKICTICGKQFYCQKGKINIKKYCSNKCRGISLEGHKKEDIGILNHRHSAGYKKVLLPDHPRSQHDGYVFEHIVLAEKKIGRSLRKNEDVHHLDGNTKNNNLDNLLVCTQKEHHRLHNGWRKIKNKWYKNCPICKKLLQVDKNNFYKRSNGKFVYHCIKCRKYLPQ